MRYIVPDYYDDFKCIAEKCKHNCCIGWEIDIDDTTLAFYKNVGGAFGERLKDNISENQFVLDKDERCPFLNERNLCDIITTLGKAHLCDICHSHPRFHNERDGYIEAGLGLCCEAAGRLILSLTRHVHLSCDQSLLPKRDEMIALMQEDSLTVCRRLSRLSDGFVPDLHLWVKRLLRLERMEQTWGDLLQEIPSLSESDLVRFDTFMTGRETEYEQLAVYLIYRHYEVKREATIGRFVTLAVTLLRRLGALLLRQNGDFTLEDQVELCRLFSAEIEYSDQNLCFLLENV